MTHTPGPYFAGKYITDDGQRTIMANPDDPIRIALIDPQTPYKRGHGWQLECSTRDANTQLLAAAPAMLAALSYATCWATGYIHSTGQVPDWLEAVETAIAKAKGL